mmetsp:Transcript_30607/g.62263  ORF Transcript_30607/g.62263 Transcript_30607/m.62263 type:complete len:389 (+) Transcript_30607:185-1351(+)
MELESIYFGGSSGEIFRGIKNNDDDDDVIAELRIYQASREGEDAIDEIFSLGKAIEKSTQIRRLDIMLRKGYDLDRWRLLAEGMAGNQSIKEIKFSVLWHGFTGLAQILQFFGPFLERNPSLEVVNVTSHHRVLSGEEMKMLSATLSRQSHPLGRFELNCCIFDDEIIREFAIAYMKNASVTPKSIDFSSFITGAFIGREGLECLIQLLETPDCAMEQIAVNLECLDADLAKQLSKALKKNNILKSISFNQTEHRRICDSVYQEFNDVLCDKSNLITTFDSNHTLEHFSLSKNNDIPTELWCNLKLNSNSNKSLVARRKVFVTHLVGDKNLGGALNEMNPTLLVPIISFFDRTIEENGGDERLFCCGANLRFSFLHQLFKRNPILIKV